jgi:hypothetical protein
MPATVCPGPMAWKWSVLMAVMIGIDPHKGSHTAVAVGAAGEPLGKIGVRACPAQAGKLVGWPERVATGGVYGQDPADDDGQRPD